MRRNIDDKLPWVQRDPSDLKHPRERVIIVIPCTLQQVKEDQLTANAQRVSGRPEEHERTLLRS